LDEGERARIRAVSLSSRAGIFLVRLLRLLRNVTIYAAISPELELKQGAVNSRKGRLTSRRMSARLAMSWRFKSGFAAMLLAG
jgi:hypothetical protein